MKITDRSKINSIVEYAHELNDGLFVLCNQANYALELIQCDITENQQEEQYYVLREYKHVDSCFIVDLAEIASFEAEDYAIANAVAFDDRNEAYSYLLEKQKELNHF